MKGDRAPDPEREASEELLRALRAGDLDGALHWAERREAVLDTLGAGPPAVLGRVRARDREITGAAEACARRLRAELEMVQALRGRLARRPRPRRGARYINKRA